MNNKNEVAVTQNTFVLSAGAGLDLGEEMAGLNISFDRIKVPAGGGIAYEVPSDNPDEPDSKKEIKAVILYHHPIQSYYAEEYSGASDPPDCSSFDGVTGIDRETGEVKACKECGLNQFGSGNNGGKACKSKRRIFLLLENSGIPVILTLPTTSIGDFSKYILRIVGKGKKSSQVVTRFTLKKDQNAGGITYSKVVTAVDRDLANEEVLAILPLAEQVKCLAKSMQAGDE